MTYSVQKLNDHITELLLNHKIKCWLKDSYGGRANRDSREIAIARVKSPVTYAVALHEIGHIVGPNPKRVLEREAEAWLWARQNAVFWNAAMSKKASRCIGSYLRWCERKKNAWVPPHDHVSREIAQWTK